ncbi:MAG: YicC family protein [Phycisphaerae bacterium]|nr:YicC family protein [Phycisphaerae bacterium]
MIRSMTGFGDASSHANGVHYFVEVRSLNNKYFKANIRLPDEFQAVEAEIDALLRQRLSRGTVTLSASMSDSSASAAHTINRQALGKYVEQLKQLPQVGGGEIRLDLTALLALPGVLQPPGDEEARLERARAALLDLTAQACERLIEMRVREGRALVVELRSQYDAIAERLTQIAARAPAVVAEYESRLKARIDALLTESGLKLEPVEVVREIAAYAERTDIAEEVMRLREHLRQFDEYLREGSDRPLGRTLDFLAQEMLREANTIASKSPDAAVSRLIVEVKGAIDRIKEQVQNVE